MYIEKEIIATKPSDYSSQTFDLKSLIVNMKLDKKWKSGEMNMLILQRDATTKIVLTILHEKTEICSFQVNDSITFQVIGGMIMLNFHNKSYILHSGDKMEINEKTSYSIDSIEETSFLMTLKS